MNKNKNDYGIKIYALIIAIAIIFMAILWLQLYG